MSRRLRALLAPVSLLALAACAVGPNYVPPIASASRTAPLIAAGAPVAESETPDRWWQLYNDPVLDRLIADALAANTDLRVAVARLDKARADLREARNDRLPQTDLSAAPQYGRFSSNRRPIGADREDWSVNLGLDVSYELDLSGRVKREIEAARGDVGAAAADSQAVRIAVVAEVTSAYVEAAAAAQQQAVAERVLGLLDRSLDVTDKRFRAGRAERLDVARLAALREQRRAEIPPLIAQRQAALYRLAMLTGRTPNELPADASVRTAPPEIAQPIPIGDGGALLARRPDVRAAERRLAADTARIGVATSELYPHISLGGSIASSGNGFSNIFGAGPLGWLLGPLISWTFPNQEGARARIAGARADTQASLASFDGTVLRAIQETDTALSNYARLIDRRRALASARDEAARAVRIVRARQREGVVDFLVLLDSERTFADTEAALAQADAALALAQVDVFKALGGGWQTPDAPVTVAGR
ncbi:efflux transporter outer membrane subunit [Sphingomonas sp. BIUV-7]|uniref:Efflux transporter outer membrane subunit n=1 Tax=Sphingomonas natans TaxID=3063330 RepID=A0ABT8YEM0_9SPHN|nr:efflux transporter outer membrane subunit [Sphingomonas sp. BIUV-7]MDO6416810.1 efflux transporter outer membrane subunit [Sphingomonas sp. BIUV-7]